MTNYVRTIRLQSNISHGVTVVGSALEITAYAAVVAWTNSCNVTICHGTGHDIDDHYGDWGAIDAPKSSKEMIRRSYGVDSPEIIKTF